MFNLNEGSRKCLFANINKRLIGFEQDHLHHLLIDKCNDTSEDLKRMFGDVRIVCMGGTNSRMYKFAKMMKSVLKKESLRPSSVSLSSLSSSSSSIANEANEDSNSDDVHDLTKGGDRYNMYKVGPVLFASHGIGCPSISVLLTEIMKLLYHAECQDVIFFRVGTCGGIGVEPGTVILTEEALDGLLRPEYRQYILGREVVRHTSTHRELIEELKQIGKDLNTNFKIVSGKTLCASDFYEAQARLDGIFCDYEDEEKLEFLKMCSQKNIVNIEMESLCFSGFLNYANCKFAIVCVSLLDRLKGDQVTCSQQELLEFQERPFRIVSEYIKKYLESDECVDSNNNRLY